MKRIFSSTVFALAAGLCLRLFLVLKFPAESGDTVLYEQIATRWPNLPILFSTGHGDENLLKNRRLGTHVGYLQKPYESDALLGALEELLDS